MNIEISTSDPDAVDPAVVAKALQDANLFVLEVNVNEGERVWTYDPGAPEEQATPVPDLHMQVWGFSETNMGDEQTEYEAVLTRTVHEGGWVYTLRILTMHGEEVSSHSFGDDDADDIIRIAGTDFSAPAADANIPIRGVPQWDVGEGEDNVTLGEGNLDEIAAWLRFATGVEEWDGGEEWEF